MKYLNEPTELACPICGFSRNTLFYSVNFDQATQHFVLKEKDLKRFKALKSHILHLWQKSEAQIIKCNNCRFVFSIPHIAGDYKFYELAYQRTGYPKWKWEYSLSYNFLEKFISSKSFDNDYKLLEIGAGNGAFIKEIIKNNLIPTKNIWCTEYSEYGKSELIDLGINYIQASLYQIKQSFNFICIFQVLEHMDQINDLFKILYSLLEKDGYIFISVPNDRRIKFNEENETLLDLPPNHIGRYNKKTFIYLAQKHGFKIYDHRIDETESFIQKVKMFCLYFFHKKSQQKGSFANLAKCIKNRYIGYALQIIVYTFYSLLLVKRFSTLRSKDLGASQFVCLLKI